MQVVTCVRFVHQQTPVGPSQQVVPFILAGPKTKLRETMAGIEVQSNGHTELYPWHVIARVIYGEEPTKDVKK